MLSPLLLWRRLDLAGFFFLGLDAAPWLASTAAPRTARARGDAVARSSVCAGLIEVEMWNLMSYCQRKVKSKEQITTSQGKSRWTFDFARGSYHMRRKMSMKKVPRSLLVNVNAYVSQKQSATTERGSIVIINH
jgi:hypothetical protein